MWSWVHLLLLVCSACLSLGHTHYGMRYSSGSYLQCYKCIDYFGGFCSNVQDCSYEDSCLYLHEKGGKTIRQCIRYTDCDNSRLSLLFPAVSGYTYRCCNTNLCNSGHRIGTAATSLLVSVLVSVLGLCWSS